MSRNNDYTTGSLLHHSHHQNHYKHIDIDLLRQTNTNIPQENNLTGQLADDSATMFFIAEKQQKNYLKFSLDSLILTKYCKQWSIKEYWICSQKLEHCQWSIKCKSSCRKWNYM